MKRRWTVEVGFNKFDGCKEWHEAWRLCSGCKDHMGLIHIDVAGETTSEAMAEALAGFADTSWAKSGYTVVSATVDVTGVDELPRRPSPPRAASQKPRSPRAPKGSTASKRGSAQKRGGKGQRKA